MAWRKLEINVPDLKLGDLAELIEKIKAIIEVIVDVLEVILAFAAALMDPIVTVLRVIIDKLKETVEGFLEDLGGYTLYVPIGKRLMTNFLGFGDITPSWAGELGIFGAPDSEMDPENPELNQFIVDANRYKGGNHGFFKTVVESLYDEGDVNRPQFLDEDDYVGGVTLVMGVDFDPLGFLDDIWKLMGMFDGPDTTPKVPRPKGLQARTLQGISSGAFSTLLLWEPPEVPVWTLADLGGIIMFPARYAIIRGRNTIGALSAGNVGDLMGSRTLSQGDTFSNGNMEVIHEGPYDITKTSYLDEGITASADDTFFYAVAWQLKVFNKDDEITDDGGTDLDYWQISNVARVTPFPTLPASTPPDWYRTPSIASLFPQFAAVLRKMVAQIEAFAAKLLGAADMLKEYIEFLKSEILRYEQIVNEILDFIAQLTLKLELPTAGIYTRTFKGQGGNDFFISDLAKSFLPSEANRPPFGRGDEYVTGAVIMTGGPEVMVDAFIAGLSWIFGGASEDGMDDMLAELGGVVDSIEATQFGPSMTQMTAAEIDAAEPVEFDSSMCPLCTCGDDGEPTPTFGKDMKES